jgi:uncharacterized protein
MLIEFRVKNFKSLRDEQVLSMVAAKDSSLLESNTVATGISAVPRLLRSAAIYGANAAGKSNLLKALQYMAMLVGQSAQLPQGQHFAVQPFRLDPASASVPTSFEATFLLDGVRYQYSVALTKERVLAEDLLVYKAFKPQRWFSRSVVDGKDVYIFGPGLKGAKHVWENATRPNSLFLSMAVQLNSEQLRPVFDWFTRQLIVVNEVAPLNPAFAVGMLKNEVNKRLLCDFLNAADISIHGLEVASRKVPQRSVQVNFITGKTELSEAEVDEHRVLFHHKTESGEVILDATEESSGTRNLLWLAGPVLDILNRGATLVVDEIDTSLHTLLVRRLVSLFHQPVSGPAGAQLIFTTHDASLLSERDLLRRDQVWLVDKDANQGSRLYPLTDFSPRKAEAIEQGYLAGRYGGTPFLQPLPTRGN